MASDEEPTSLDEATASPRGEAAGTPGSAGPAEGVQSGEASEGGISSIAVTDAGQAADIRHLIDGIDAMPLAERAEVFDTVNRRIAERLTEFDGI
ncbi:MAG: hypothetical protein WD358_07825 [Nitriliruptoraceae bacterium]